VVPTSATTDMTSFRAHCQWQMRAACVVEWEPSYMNYNYLMARVEGLPVTSTPARAGLPVALPLPLQPRLPTGRPRNLKAGRPSPLRAGKTYGKPI
jgi:hypothetical protein